MWVSHFAARFCNGRLCRRIHTCGMRPASLIGSSAVSADRSVSVFWIGSFLPLPCAAEAKIPSRATQKVAAGAASASRHCPAAHKDAGYETDQKPCFGALFSLRLYRQVESLRCANARRRLGATGRTRTADLLITNQLLYQLSHSSKYFFLLPTLGKKCRASNSFYIINRTFCFCKPFLKNL